MVGGGLSTSLAADGRFVSYEVDGEPVRAYLIQEGRETDLPGFVLLHDWWGLNEHARGVAERAAERGYVAIVPDFYRGKLPSDLGWAHDYMRKVDDRWAIRVIRGAVNFLRRMPGGEARPTGLVGFDMGGRLGLEAALRGVPVQAAVNIYGAFPTDEKSLRFLRVPFLGIFGREDPAYTAEEIETLEKNLEALGKTSKILVLYEVGRFFFNEERPGYDEESSHGAWEQTLQFLQEHLNGEAGPSGQPQNEADAGFEKDLRKKRSPDPRP